MKMNNKKYFLGISLLLITLLSLGGYFVWRYYFTACCEPPLEVIQMQVEADSKNSFTGRWIYFNRDAEGYSSGIDLTVNQVDNKVAGEFNMVWSFPKAPAARLNNGNFQGKLAEGNEKIARVEWKGSRDDSGTALIRYLEDRDAIEWQAMKSTVTDLTMPDSVILYRNRWLDLTHEEQTALIKVSEDALKQIPGMETGGIEIEATTVVGNRAEVLFFSADGEDSGSLFLQQEGETWKVIPDPESGSITS